MNVCPVCQSSSSVAFVKKHDEYDILFCSDCNLQFSHPMENPGRDYYQKCDIYESRSEYNQLSISDYDWRFRTFFRKCSKNPNQSILDIGCGDGGFLSLARDRGFNVFGLEIDERAARLSRDFRKLENIECGDWEQLKDIGWKNFDVITLFDVLEHISLPCSIVSTIFEMLQPGGIVCITVPRIDRFPRLFDPVADFPPHHFTLWSSKALNVLLSKAGFSVIDIVEKPLSANDCLVHLKWRLKRLLSGGRSDPNDHSPQSSMGLDVTADLKTERIKRIAKRVVYIILNGINHVLQALRIGQGHTILVIARKE